MKNEVKTIYESVLFPGTSWCERRLSDSFLGALKWYVENILERDGRNS